MPNPDKLSREYEGFFFSFLPEDLLTSEIEASTGSD
jgi:hypothetical protein